MGGLAQAIRLLRAVVLSNVKPSKSFSSLTAMSGRNGEAVSANMVAEPGGPNPTEAMMQPDAGDTTRARAVPVPTNPFEGEPPDTGTL